LCKKPSARTKLQGLGRNPSKKNHADKQSKKKSQTIKRNHADKLSKQKSQTIKKEINNHNVEHNNGT